MESVLDNYSKENVSFIYISRCALSILGLGNKVVLLAFINPESFQNITTMSISLPLNIHINCTYEYYGAIYFTVVD